MAASTAPVARPCGLLALSTELRCQIYERLVVIGKVFYTPEQYSIRNEKRLKDSKAYKTPELSILRVCKQIHDEAEDIYLSRNLFVLPDFFACKEFNYSKHQCLKRPLFSSAGPKLVKNISLAFSTRLPKDSLVDSNFLARMLSNISYGQMRFHEPTLMAHE
jgi:hypothetical protein